VIGSFKDSSPLEYGFLDLTRAIIRGPQHGCAAGFVVSASRSGESGPPISKIPFDRITEALDLTP
jgi:hypothetical protein